MNKQTPRGFEQVTKSGEFSAPHLHPTPGRKTVLKGRDLPAYGGTDGMESKYVRCKQCGFILDSTRTPRGSGYGNEVAVLKTGSTTVYNNVTTSAGCPLCGASEY